METQNAQQWNFILSRQTAGKDNERRRHAAKPLTSVMLTSWTLLTTDNIRVSN